MIQGNVVARVFIVSSPFVFILLDIITKNRALASREYVLSPHFLSFAIPLEIIFGTEILLVAFFAAFYFIPKIFFHVHDAWRHYFFGDFPAHVLLLGSIASNTYDLIQRGGIVDWINLGAAKTNLADAGIIIGIGILVWRALAKMEGS